MVRKDLKSFVSGCVYLTRGVNDLVAESSAFAEFVSNAFKRHIQGDWGDLPQGDRESNDQAVMDGSRLLSAYVKEGQPKIWIITEADRSATTILFPDEY